MTSKTLQAAMEEAAALPKAAQDEIAREVFERVNNIARIRQALEVGIDELDEGLGAPVDFGGLRRRLRKEHE
jgi:hypothetical protein